MQVLVVGATGHTGQRVLKHLDNSDHTAYGLTRSPDQAEKITACNAKPIIGDLEANIDTTVEGMDAIIFVAGSRGTNIEGVDYQGVEKMVSAATKSNCQRFLYIGSLNTYKPREQYLQEMRDYYQQLNQPVPEDLAKTIERDGYYDYLQMKALAEKSIIESPLDYTILRAGLLTHETDTHGVNVSLDGTCKFGTTSRDAIAQCFIAALENTNTRRKIYTVLDGDTPIKQAFG
ncbi:MAG: SDR family oxidoreductase [Coxiellaceae bacterium]|nr:SDR family oxidoreductase [Coxiellaceae bacterium]